MSSAVYAEIEFIPQIPLRTINVDGNPSDWAGIDPWITDPQGDSSCGAGTDFKAVYLARDATYIYWRMDTWDGNFSSGDPSHFKYPMIHFYVADPSTPSYGLKWQRMQNGYGVVLVMSQPGGEWVQKYQGIEYGVIGTVAEGKIPLSILDPFLINNVMIFYYAGYHNTAGDAASRTYTSGISGYWDEYVRDLGPDKVDVKYFRQDGSIISGKSSLGGDISGTISGSNIALSFSDIPECPECSGTISGQSISCTCTEGAATGAQINFSNSTCHFTNFVPGHVFKTLTPTFAWTSVTNADSYRLEISKDKQKGDCGETSSCVYMWEKNPIISLGIQYNSDGAASSPLQPGVLYRIRVTALKAGSEIDKTFDVRFRVTQPASPGAPWIPLLLEE